MLLQNAIDLAGLPGAQALVGVEAPGALEQALAAQHLVAAGDAAVERMGDVEERRVAVGNAGIERKDIGGNRTLTGRMQPIKEANGALMFHLDISVSDVDAFVTSPAHETKADGYIESALFGGKRPVSNGVVNLFINAGEPSKKNMRYRLFFTGSDGRDYTLAGFKDISGPSVTRVWDETTTLYTQVLEGHVAAGQPGPVVGSGVLVIRPEDFFFKQLFSFRTQGPSLEARLAGLNRFGAMFFGKVWDVYGRQAGPF